MHMSYNFNIYMFPSLNGKRNNTQDKRQLSDEGGGRTAAMAIGNNLTTIRAACHSRSRSTAHPPPRHANLLPRAASKAEFSHTARRWRAD